MSEQFTFFYRTAHPFSQWYSSEYQIDGITFYTAEQYMMYGKAMLFGDEEIAQKILQTTDPREQKALGRQVRNFDPVVWEREAKNIVYKANYAKFTQNENLKKFLLKTEGTTLVEASPTDVIWGIGMDESHPDRFDKSKWRGTNWLGEVLTQLREDLLATE
jgi:ribA/ribD-fused uncharacterized protein